MGISNEHASGFTFDTERNVMTNKEAIAENQLIKAAMGAYVLLNERWKLLDHQVKRLQSDDMPDDTDGLYEALFEAIKERDHIKPVMVKLLAEIKSITPGKIVEIAQLKAQRDELLVAARYLCENYVKTGRKDYMQRLHAAVDVLRAAIAKAEKSQ